MALWGPPPLNERNGSNNICLLDANPPTWDLVIGAHQSCNVTASWEKPRETQKIRQKEIIQQAWTLFRSEMQLHTTHKTHQNPMDLTNSLAAEEADGSY